MRQGTEPAWTQWARSSYDSEQSDGSDVSESSYSSGSDGDTPDGGHTRARRQRSSLLSLFTSQNEAASAGSSSEYDTDASDTFTLEKSAPWIRAARRVSNATDATPPLLSAAKGAPATEQDVRRALFEQNVRVREYEVDPRRVTRGRPSVSFGTSTAPTTLPMQMISDRASDDPWGALSYADKEYRGDVTRLDASSGEELKVAEVWEDLPPLANKDYGTSSSRAQHHLVRCTGYDPTAPPRSKKEVPVSFHERDVNSAQFDFERRVGVAKETVMHDVFRNGNFEQPHTEMDTSRSNYEGGGYNPIRSDDLQRRALAKNATWRGAQDATPAQRSEAFALVAQRPVSAQPSRSRSDAHLGVDAPLVGSAEQVVHISATAPLPCVSSADRTVAAFRDAATAAGAGDGRQLLGGEVVLVDERSVPIGEPARRDASHANTVLCDGAVRLAAETTAAVPLRFDAEAEGRVFLPVPTHLDDKREAASPLPRDDHAMQSPAFAVLPQNVQRTQQNRSQTAPSRPQLMDTGAFLERVLPGSGSVSREDDPELSRIEMGVHNAGDGRLAPLNVQTRGRDATERARVQASDPGASASAASQRIVPSATTLAADDTARRRVQHGNGAAQGGDFTATAFTAGSVAASRMDDSVIRRVTADCGDAREARLGLEGGIHAVTRADDAERRIDSLADTTDVGRRSSAPVIAVSVTDAHGVAHPTAADLLDTSSPALQCVTVSGADAVRRPDDAPFAEPGCAWSSLNPAAVDVRRLDSSARARIVADAQSARAPARPNAAAVRATDATQAPAARPGLMATATRALARFGRVDAKPQSRAPPRALPTGYSSSFVVVVSDVDRIPIDEQSLGDPFGAVGADETFARLPAASDSVETQRTSMPEQPFGHAAVGGREPLFTPSNTGIIALRAKGGLREGPLRASLPLPVERLRLERRVAGAMSVNTNRETAAAAPRGRASPLHDTRGAVGGGERGGGRLSSGRGTPTPVSNTRSTSSEYAHTHLRMPSPALRG